MGGWVGGCGRVGGWVGACVRACACFVVMLCLHVFYSHTGCMLAFVCLRARQGVVISGLGCSGSAVWFLGDIG